MKDANPSLPHSILGPDNKNAGKDWTIGKNRGKLLEGTIRFGSAFKVKLEISGGTPASVTWDPFTQVQHPVCFFNRQIEVPRFFKLCLLKNHSLTNQNLKTHSFGLRFYKTNMECC